MAWRDRLIDASFKNVSFKVKSHDYSTGRRTYTHQFANREKPFTQDLGQKAEEFSIEAYIVQNLLNDYDYFTERDNLIRALRQKGAGVLFHPFLGIKKVNSVGFSMSEDFTEGGIARFSIDFTESGERALPENLVEFFQNVDNAVNQAMDLIGDGFYTAYSTVALFQDSTTNIITRSMGTITQALSLTSGIATKIISEATANVALIRNDVTDIINTPIDIFNALKNCCYSMASVCGMGSVLISEQSIKGYATDNGVALNDKSEDVFANRLTISTTTTGGETGQYSGVVRGNVTELEPNNIDDTLGKSVITNMINLILNFDMSGLGNVPPIQEENVALILDTFKFQVIATICRIAIRINFFEQEDAINMLEDINEMIDEVLIDMGNEAANGTSALGIGTGTTQIDNKDIFLSIQDMRKTFTDNMQQKISGIAKGLNYRIPTDIETSLELAYNKYVDLDRSKEIYDNNRIIIQHPGFMPPNDVIRILDV